jgi:hypothetical protein
MSGGENIDKIFSKITFENKNGKTSNLYFTENSNTSGSLQKFELPPLPPAGSFDVRFKSNRFVEHFSPGKEGSHLGISLQAIQGPIKFSWAISGESGSIYEISQESGGGWKQTLAGNGTIILPDCGNQNLILVKKSVDEIPKGFIVDQNFPNPFNPTTTISFTLPQPSLVNVKVFNTIGQVISVLANKNIYPAGQVHLTFTSNNLPSGVYYYSVDAQNIEGGKTFRATKKMILLQ